MRKRCLGSDKGEAMIIRNAKIYTPEHEFKNGTLVISGEKVKAILPAGCAAEAAVLDGAEADPAEEIIDAGGLMAIPGLVDIHFHGAVGHDFCNADLQGLKAIAEFEASKGVLAICPATMTFPEDVLGRIMDNARSFAEAQRACNARICETAGTEAAGKAPEEMIPDYSRTADLVGINMEGPFISPDRIGAQNPDHVIKADAEMFRRLQKRSGGLIRLADIAPEVPGNMDFIRSCSGEVKISIAHTCIDYETAAEAFQLGAVHMTHLYNAMPGINHRNPGPIIAALEHGAEVELITDNVHIHPAMVRFTFHTFGADRVCLIADSMEACGLPDGQYSLGGQEVTVRGRRAELTAHPGTIAGSCTCLYDCMKRAVQEMQVPLVDAVRAAGENPARAIGIDNAYGSFRKGCFANVLLVDDDLELKAVYRRGRKL